MKYLLSNHARIFQAIVEAGSITGAADHMQMGKSGVSDALKQLESSLGAQLLIRTTRRQSLTAIGEQFYRRCRELNDLSTVALEEVSEHLAEPMGALRITAPHATIDNIVAPAIAQLVATYPRVLPEVLVDDKRLDLIQNNIDVALTAGELASSEFKAQKVGVLHDVLCASPDFCRRETLAESGIPWSDRAPELAYVAHHWEGSDIMHELASLVDGKVASFRFRRVATASSVNAVAALISRSVGVGILPHFFLQPMLKAGTLVKLLPEYQPRETNLYAVHPYGSNPPLGVRAMIDAMKSSLATPS